MLGDHRSGADPAAVVRWAVQICEGLAAAHRAGVVHRDIKPANIMVHGPAEADVTICDFGIARLAEETGTGLTATGAAIGTPTYMSPEQARGDRRIDGRSDLYSLGCMLYELLSGRPPFTGSGLSVLSQHLTSEPTPIRNLRPSVPEKLERLVLELLAKEPAARPADAQQVIDRLRKAATRVRPQPRPQPRPRPRPEPRPRSRAAADPAAEHGTATALGADAPAAAPAVRGGSGHPIPASSVPGTRPRLLWGSLLAAAGVYAQLVGLRGWGSTTLMTLGAALLAYLVTFFVSRSSADVTDEDGRGSRRPSRLASSSVWCCCSGRRPRGGWGCWSCAWPGWRCCSSPISSKGWSGRWPGWTLGWPGSPPRPGCSTRRCSAAFWRRTERPSMRRWPWGW